MLPTPRVILLRDELAGRPCAACHAPVERPCSLQWCDCVLCYSCARGVVWACPVCYSHPPPLSEQPVDISGTFPDKSGDFSGWWWIGGLLALAGLLIWMEWYF